MVAVRNDDQHPLLLFPDFVPDFAWLHEAYPRPAGAGGFQRWMGKGNTSLWIL